MPSFLNDENSPIYSQTLGIVHLDPAAQFGLPQEKTTVNGHIPCQPPPPQPSNDSFEDSSTTHSTRASDDSGARATQLNGDDHSSWPSMSTVQNGSPDGGSKGLSRTDSTVDSEWSKPLPVLPVPNGKPTTLVDRTVQSKPLVNGTKDSDSSAPSPKDVFPRPSMGSATGSIQHSPVDMHVQNGNKTDIRIVESSPSSPGQSSSLPVSPPPNGTFTNLAAASSPSLAPTTPTAEANQHPQNSPHRFSSPPTYQSSGPSPNSSGALQAPGGGTIKHRHTLEVPKVAPTRGSRDGSDSAFSSGRFSPTAVGGRRASLSLVRRNTRSLHSEVPRDEVVPDDDALRWAEAYREKRASKRRRREIEDDDRVLVGTKVDETHANWVTAYNMLTGIRVSVSRTNARLDRELTDADFDLKQKSTFDITGNELVPSAKYDFKFKDYAPWVFRHLRQLFRLDPADYLISLTGKYILSELGSPGKSGSFFYFSRDYKYIIKTIHHSEHKFLRKVLKDYYQHVVDNPNTLLSQFYGLHRVKMPYGKKIHFVVMNNLFPPHRDIHQTFDLKGSTVGRDYKEDDLAKNPRATMKDLNWLRRKKHIELGIQKKRLFLDQLMKDVKLLQRLQIMDYSLLIGIHDLQKGNEENVREKTLTVFNPGGNGTEEAHPVFMRTPSVLETQRKARELRQMIQQERPVPVGETLPNELEEGQNRSGFVFNQDDGGFRATRDDNAPGDEIYYLGVIDCLTHYGMIKKIEHFWKGLNNDKTQISALPPKEYGDRFLNFIQGITMSEEEAHRQAAERDAALAAEAAAAEQQERERVASWGSTRRRSSNSRIPPIPEYEPPAPPTASGHRSPEVDATMQRAEHEARKTEMRGANEDNIPNRVLRTKSVESVGQTLSHPPEHGAGNPGAVLPVVEEAAEGASTESRTRSRTSHVSSLTSDGDVRPLTPAKDGEENQAGFGNPLLGRVPPTPPKTGYNGYGSLKPQSADSGYGVTGSVSNINASMGLRSIGGSQKSIKAASQLGRDSLDKALPPLPTVDSTPTPSLQRVS